MDELFSEKIKSRYDLCDAMIDGILPKPIYKSAYTKSSYAGNLKGIDVSYHNGRINWKKV